jgi:hypothetical protein
MSSIFPLELYEIIIDNLDDYEDKATLHACSLTCKGFLHASRCRLFHHACLRGRRGAQSFFDTISTNSSTNPSAYVRKLSIHMENDDYNPEWLNQKFIPFITTHLPNVTILKLHSFDWDKLDDTARPMMLSGFPKVKRLEIMYNASHRSAELNKFIASFPSLKDLLYLHSYNGSQGPVIPLPPGVKCITLSSSHLNFFDRLLGLESHPDVRPINLRIIKFEMFPEHLAKLLKTAGPRLECLYLKADIRPSGQQIFHRVVLPHRSDLLE